MNQTLPQLIRSTAEDSHSLTEAEAQSAVGSMLDGNATDVQIAALLTALAVRGETADEITGFVRGLRERAVPIQLTGDERAQLVDTCGTGGDGCGTFNISTAAALVAVAAGAKVAKHGNRAVSSNCGSADVLEALGVAVDLGPGEAAECLRQTGFVFLHAPRFHPAMARVGPVRRALPFRTIFNLVGPLSNPAGARQQVMGIFAADRLACVAESMRRLGVRRGMVVHGSDGLDELTTTGPSALAFVNGENPGDDIVLCDSYPAHAEFESAQPNDLRGGRTAAENAAILLGIFNGEPGPRRDIVLLNAAAALVAAGLSASLPDGIAKSAHAIDSRAVTRLLQELRVFTADTRSLQVR